MNKIIKRSLGTLIIGAIFTMILSSCDIINGMVNSSSSFFNPSFPAFSSSSSSGNVSSPINGDHTVIFDLDNGEDSVQVQVLNGHKVSEPKTPNKEGYYFNGWYHNEQEWDFNGSSVTESMTLKASWIPLSYKIELNVNGELHTFFFDYNTIVNLSTLVPVDYIEEWQCNGFVIANDKFSMKDLDLKYAYDNEKEVYCFNFEAILRKYTISFEYEGIEDMSVQAFGAYVLPSISDKDFVGWYCPELNKYIDNEGYFEFNMDLTLQPHFDKTNNLDDVNGDGETLKLSVKYQSKSTTMRFDDNLLRGDGTYTGANGKTYNVGDFKPVWEQIQKDLDFTIEDVTDLSNSSYGDSFKNRWAPIGFEGVDVLNGNSTQINEYGVTNNSFIRLDEYLDYMPNFKAFLAENKTVEMSITANDGHIYYSPYFDGYNDLEKMFICRQDWVRKLLDEEVIGDTTTLLPATEYKHYMPDSLDTYIEVTDENGQIIKINKHYEANIIDIQDSLDVKDGASLLKALRDHIDSTYGNQYAKRSDLFLSSKAAYDADELVALFRVVRTNPQLLTGQSDRATVPYYCREYKANRYSDIFRLAAIWGVRGLESRSEYFYIDKNGVLKDARNEKDTKEALVRMNQLYKEGLICPNFDERFGSGNWRTDLNAKVDNGSDALGFMTYDYSQTTVSLNANGQSSIGAHFDLAPIMPAVAKWDDKDEATNYFHFTESVRSVKTDGWCINASLLKEPKKLKKALELFDYLHSKEGNTLMSYGPKEWLEETPTCNYRGEIVPTLNDKALAELNDMNLGAGNYTNYYRRYLGGMLPVGYVKQQGMEYQSTHSNGQKGLDNILSCWTSGTLKHLYSTLDEGDDPFYTLVPNTFALTNVEENIKATNFYDLSSNFQSTSSGYILFADVVKGFITIDEYSSLIEQYNVNSYVELYSSVYERMLNQEYLADSAKPKVLAKYNASEDVEGKVEEDLVVGDGIITFEASSARYWTIEVNHKTSSDGIKFTQRIKTGGKTTAEGRYITVVCDGPVVLRFYAVSASSAETRKVVVVKDWSEVGSVLPEEGIIETFDVIPVDLHPYEVELEKGTYTLYMAASINFYQIEILEAE